MADRYWVGGTAAWDGTAGSKWAETSGGAGGFSVPTTSDDVFFDAASSGTCTISSGNTGAKSINCTGFTGTIAGSANMTVAGSVTLDVGQNYTHTGAMVITGTGTIITAGKSFSRLSINGSGITVDLGDAITFTTSISSPFLQVSQGTFNTNNYNITSAGTNGSAQFNIEGTSTRTVNLGSSTITIGQAGGISSRSIEAGSSPPTNLTFNAGTSTFILTASNVGFIRGQGLTFYNLSYTTTGALNTLISGANTFNNISVTGPASIGVSQLTFDSRQTINGTLSTTGTAGNRRVWFRSSTYGIAQTLTINGSTSLTDADFRDIYVVGTAAPISGTRIGNRGACRGITFSTPKNVYWNLSGSQNWSADGWASGSGGTPNTDNFPLPQDTAIFDDTGAAGTITLNNAIGYAGSVDMSSRTTAMTFTFTSNGFTVYGSWTNGSGTSLGAVTSGALTFSGEGTKTITSAGKQWQSPIVIDAYNGVIELADAMYMGNVGTLRSFNVSNGTFDTKNYNLTTISFNSTNSNVRSIKFGSSTITIASNQSVNFNFTNPVNLTFDAGTSLITYSISGTCGFLGGNQTFYNVSFPQTSASITGSNTFNDLTITASSTTGVRSLTISDNQTVNGTLTVAGDSAVRRILVLSNTLGAPRTLTVGTIAATDCDFRDITIAGTAAGSSPTRAGDLGGNSGITFPAPKTVYWNLSGTQDWSANAWAATSGGSPAVDNFPLAQDTAVFNDAGSVGTVTLTSTFATSGIDMSARTSAMTITTSTNTVSIYGDWEFGTGVTSSSTTGVLTFVKRGTSTITSNGVTFNFPITINCVNNVGTVQLADALVLDAARTFTLTTGTFDAVTHNVTTGLYSGSSGATLKMGSGLWTLSGTGTVWSQSATLLKGTANILLSDNSTTARTFAGGGWSYNKLTIGGTTSTSTTTITGNNQFNELDSTKTVAHTIALGTTAQTFGTWSVTGTSGNVVTLTGTGTGHKLIGDVSSGIDYLDLGAIRFSASSPTEFYAGSNSTATGSPVAPTFLSTPPAGRTLYWVGGTGNWNDTARWSLSSGGAGGEPTPTSLDDVVFDSASNATGYTVTINAITGGNRIKSWTASGPATGNVTFAGIFPPLFFAVHGSISFAATNIVASTLYNAFVFSGTQTGRTITTNGVNFNASIEINGIGCEVSLGNSLSSTSAGGGTTGALNIVNGTFDCNGYNYTCTQFISANNNDRTIDFGSGTFTISLLAGITTASVSGQNLTFIRGTSTFSTPSLLPGVLLNHFYNVLWRISTFGFSGISYDLICENNFSCAGSSITSRTSVFSSTTGVTRTITCASASLDNANISDIAIAGSAAPVSPAGASDAGGNSGIIFPAPKTVYRVGTNTTWVGSSSWALTSGGTGSNNNLPLYQDTAVIDDNTALTGTLTITGGISELDCSTRTTGITLSFTGGSTWFGSLTLSSATTVTGTSGQTFASRSRTMTLTSAGNTLTFPITVDAVGGTFELGDAMTMSNAITHTRGTLNANNYNITTTTFASNNSNTRTLAIGSGTWTISGSGTSAWTAATSTGLTVTGTGVIKLTSTSAKTFAGGGVAYTNITLDHGGTGALTISGNNTFKDIINTSGGETSILLANTTQRVDQWTGTGTSGNVLTITGSSAASPATLILTGATDPDVNYLTITGIRAYDLTDTWYAGANSTNNGSLGWYFEAGTPPPPPAGGTGAMFLMFL